MLVCQTNQPRRILVVDDHGDIRQISPEVIVRFDHKAAAVPEAAAVWEALLTGQRMSKPRSLASPKQQPA